MTYTPPIRRYAKKSGRKLENLIGSIFGYLLIVAISDRTYGRGQKVYEASCACGNKLLVPAKALRSGNTFSCGCFRIKQSRKLASNLNRDLNGKFVK